MAFAFYDFETTGANPAFDQPLQFAAVLTDDDFNEIDRVNFRCRLAPHILPSPVAMAITRVTPSMMTDPSLPSWFEFAGILRQLVEKWTPACWTGYNSIRFDEEVLRHTFYQNLQPEIFMTQFNGNQRMDMLRAVQSVRMLEPGILDWPEVDGKISYRLDRLAPENGFADHDAHDALGDVLATVHLARRIRDRAPETWTSLLANRDRKNVMARLETGRPMVLVENHFGRLKICRGCFCGVQNGYDSAVAFLDLETGDPADLLDADDEVIMAALGGEHRRILVIATNKDPSLFDLPGPPPVLSRRAEAIASRPDFHARVGTVMAKRYEGREEPEHVEKRIYSGFYSYADKELLQKFQQAEPGARIAMISECSDDRIRQLGHRVLLSESPELFPAEHLEKAALALAARWKAQPGRNVWTTLEQVRADLDKLSATSMATGAEIEDIRAFIEDRVSRASSGVLPG